MPRDISERAQSMRREQDGSATIEATIALVAFIFVIVAIYSLVNFCIVQAKVSYAVDNTAKEMSQYAYFYHVSGARDAENSLKADSQTALSTFNELSKTVNQADYVAGEIESVGVDDYLTGVLDGSRTDLDDLYDQIQSASSSISSAVDNPATFMKSTSALAGEGALDVAKSRLIAAPMAKGMCKRHFESGGEDANAYLERMGVVNGYDGLNFNLSTLFSDDDSSMIEIVVYYRMSLKELIPGFDQEVVLSQRAITKGWLGGDDA